MLLAARPSVLWLFEPVVVSRHSVAVALELGSTPCGPPRPLYVQSGNGIGAATPVEVPPITLTRPDLDTPDT